MEVSLDRLGMTSCGETPKLRCLRHSYIDSAQVGSIVAFRQSSFSVKSAKIVKKSTRDRKFLVRTKYGSEFFIDFDDVVWVKTANWWPKWVFNLLKGIEESDEAET